MPTAFAIVKAKEIRKGKIILVMQYPIWLYLMGNYIKVREKSRMCLACYTFRHDWVELCHHEIRTSSATGTSATFKYLHMQSFGDKITLIGLRVSERII